ncbi:MAG: signal peptide peptidase SppA [Nitratireductor sp.]|nr:signal peptide peptidase SppA [Nitratireductor sp.]
MAQSVDEIIDRRRLRRKVTFWRVTSLFVLAAFLVALFTASGLGEKLSKKGSDHIARVKIDGMITNDRPMLELIADLKKKKHVKAVILDISSPGGSTVGGEAIYEAVRDLAGEKPVAASVGTLAASAGYMIACATDHIVSRRSSMVGSIGVLVQYGDVSTLMEKLGVKIDAVKSSPLKAEPSPFHPASEEARQMLGRVVDDSYQWFVDLVAERRNFDPGKARGLANGAIFTGAQGLKNGLVDEIGDEETAKKWLVAERGISDKLKIVEWKPERSDYVSNPVSLAALARLFGIDPAAIGNQRLWESLERRLFLDGLVSLMQIDFPSSEGK